MCSPIYSYKDPCGQTLSGYSKTAHPTCGKCLFLSHSPMWMYKDPYRHILCLKAENSALNLGDSGFQILCAVPFTHTKTHADKLSQAIRKQHTQRVESVCFSLIVPCGCTKTRTGTYSASRPRIAYLTGGQWIPDFVCSPIYSYKDPYKHSMYRVPYKHSIDFKPRIGPSNSGYDCLHGYTTLPSSRE